MSSSSTSSSRSASVSDATHPATDNVATTTTMTDATQKHTDAASGLGQVFRGFGEPAASSSTTNAERNKHDDSNPFASLSSQEGQGVFSGGFGSAFSTAPASSPFASGFGRGKAPQGGSRGAAANNISLRSQRGVRRGAAGRVVPPPPARADDDDVVTARLEEARKLIEDDDIAKKIDGVTAVRKMLSVANNPPVSQVIQSGLVATFIEFLQASSPAESEKRKKKGDSDEATVEQQNNEDQLPKKAQQRSSEETLCFEAAWALTNIASGDSDQSAFLVQAGCAPPMVELLKNPNDDIREQATWCLGNLAGDSVRMRDYIISIGAVPLIFKCLVNSEGAKMGIQRNAAWSMQNLCRGSPPVPFSVFEPYLDGLLKLVKESNTDAEVRCDAVWCFSHVITGSDEDAIQKVLDMDILPPLVRLISDPSYTRDAVLPIIRLLGNITSGTDAQSMAVAKSGALPQIKLILNGTRPNVQRSVLKEICWTLSNLTACGSEGVTAVLDADLFPDIVKFAHSCPQNDVRREALFAFTNAFANIDRPMLDRLLGPSGSSSRNRVFEAFAAGCLFSDVRLALAALQCLSDVLDLASRTEDDSGTDVLDEMAACSPLLDALEDAQRHPNQKIYEAAVQVLEYFETEEEEEEEEEKEQESEK